MAFKPLTLNTPPEKAAHILAEDDAAIYEALLGDDRVLDIGNKLAATVITNNSVRISDGVAVVGGHVGRIKKGDYQDMTIENGMSGKKRNDLICARFITNGDTDTYNLVVVKGAAGTTAIDPSVVKGNLYAGDKQRDFPLWRVCLDGLSITKVQQMFSVSKTNKYFSDQLDQLNRNIQTTNGLLGSFKYVDSSSTGTNGGMSMTNSVNLEAERMYIVVVRNLNGSDGVYPPYMYLLYMRNNGWSKTLLGTEKDVNTFAVQNHKLTITFKTTQFARMWIYQI